MSVDWRKLPRKPRPDLAARNREAATHGMTGSPTYKSWDAMRQRCVNPNDRDYADYGGRGIAVCERWQTSFSAFASDMGMRPAGMTLGRIDNNGAYEPGNCRWETVQQQNNNRRSSRSLTAKGRTQTLAQWAREIGVSRALLRYRVEAGWPPEQVVDPIVNRALRRI